jgi:hypothetical protein
VDTRKASFYLAGLALSHRPAVRGGLDKSSCNTPGSFHLWLRFAALWFAVVLIGFVEGDVFLPFGLTSFLGASHRPCSLARCAEVVRLMLRLTQLVWLVEAGRAVVGERAGVKGAATGR